MGSWNPKPFGDDTALDWLEGLADSREISYLANTINRITGLKDPLDAHECEEAIAAAAVIAAATVESITQVPQPAKTWILQFGFAPSKHLILAALTALQRIVAESELRELWQESGSDVEWRKETDKVIQRLWALIQSRS